MAWWISGAVLLAFLIPGSAAAQDHAEADSLETRPLKNIMVSLGQDMNRVNDGLWREDFEMILMGARAIADHPRVPPAEMTAIREALGSRFDQFVGFDQAVHETAVELVGAAERRAMGDVLESYRRLQTGCLSCHIAFRDEVRAGLYGQPPSKPNDTSN